MQYADWKEINYFITDENIDKSVLKQISESTTVIVARQQDAAE
jgi:DeoR/GlpR family transcriptional regulator of sugar metabolism